MCCDSNVAYHGVWNHGQLIIMLNSLLVAKEFYQLAFCEANPRGVRFLS